MILVLAGTAEGRHLVSLLGQRGWPVIASVTSSYGAEMISSHGSEVTVIEGQLDQGKFTSLIKDKEVKAVVDATHPFAQQISRLAMQTSAGLQIPYLRLDRPSLLPEHPLVKPVSSLEQMEEYFLPDQKVFSTLGSRHLPQLFAMIKRKQAKLTARVLATREAIQVCEELGLQPDQIMAIKGPFSEEFNKEMFRHSGAELIITKESGKVGGLDTKIEAALELNIPILIWTRPIIEYPLVLHSSEEVVQYLISIHQGG